MPSSLDGQQQSACSSKDYKYREHGSGVVIDGWKNAALQYTSAYEPKSLAREAHDIRIGLAMHNLFSACPCGIDHLKRTHRSTWMRMLPWLRLYRCDNCGKLQLHSQREIDVAKAKREAQAGVATKPRTGATGSAGR